MSAALNGLGSQLFGWFGQLSIELAVLAVLVLVASRLLPIKSPALRHLLWAVVLLKPLVAIAVSSPYSLFTPFVSLVEPSQDALAFSPVEYPTVQVAASPTIATSSVPLTTAGWGAILWIVGAALLIGRILDRLRHRLALAAAKRKYSMTDRFATPYGRRVGPSTAIPRSRWRPPLPSVRRWRWASCDRSLSFPPISWKNCASTNSP